MVLNQILQQEYLEISDKISQIAWSFDSFFLGSFSRLMFVQLSLSWSSISSSACPNPGNIIATNSWCSSIFLGFNSLIFLNRENSPADKVKEAHRRVMVANHPDAGGSHYLASKINEAKDVMLGKRKSSDSAF